MVKILILIVSCAIIVLTLMQAGKSTGISGLTTASNLTLFNKSKNRGSDRTLSIATGVLIAVFMGLVGVQMFV